MLADQLRVVLSGADEYASMSKPIIDWDDTGAREALIDRVAKDASACLAFLDGRDLDDAVQAAARLLATVVGQALTRAPTGCSGSPAGWRRTG